MRCSTLYKKNVIEQDEARRMYEFLKWNICWEEGVRSKKGFTRKAKPLNFGDIKEVDDVIKKALSKITDKAYNVGFIYLNYYEDGNMWCPNHTHKGTHQFVISLGEERVLNVGKKEYKMGNGDVILFGSSLHGVPKSDTTKGRIAIAVFMEPIF